MAFCMNLKEVLRLNNDCLSSTYSFTISMMNIKLLLNLTQPQLSKASFKEISVSTSKPVPTSSQLGKLCRQAVQSAKRPCTSVSFLLAAACTSDSSDTNSNHPKSFKLLDQREMTHAALIRQACSMTANSSSQLLTQVLVAITDTSQRYRTAMSELMVLLEESILLISNSRHTSLNDVEDLIVEQRSIIEEQRNMLLELVSLMDYVEKMVTSTAETAFLAGAEQSSGLVCERLNSALNKVKDECAANKRSEEELLKLQAVYVAKLAELYEREWKGEEKTDLGRLVPEDFNKSHVTPVDIFETSPSDHELDDKSDSKQFI